MIDKVLTCYPGSKFTLKDDTKDDLLYESLGFKPDENSAGLYYKF